MGVGGGGTAREGVRVREALGDRLERHEPRPGWHATRPHLHIRQSRRTHKTVKAGIRQSRRIRKTVKARRVAW